MCILDSLKKEQKAEQTIAKPRLNFMHETKNITLFISKIFLNSRILFQTNPKLENPLTSAAYILEFVLFYTFIQMRQ